MLDNVGMMKYSAETPVFIHGTCVMDLVFVMTMPQLKRKSAQILKTLNVPPGIIGKPVKMSLVQNTSKMSVIEKIQTFSLVLIEWTKQK